MNVKGYENLEQLRKALEPYGDEPEFAENVVDSGDAHHFLEVLLELIGKAEKVEEQLEHSRKHIREKVWVDATPDRELPARILKAYIDETHDTDNLIGLDPTSPLCIEMNKARDERNAIIREAIRALASTDSGKEEGE